MLDIILGLIMLFLSQKETRDATIAILVIIVSVFSLVGLFVD